jgi:hypothetical protein
MKGMMPSMPAIHTFLLVAAGGRRADPVQRPPLELILVAVRQLLSAGKIDWLADHRDLVLQLGERVFHAAADQVDSEVRDVDADPVAAKFLRRVYRSPSSAERVENDVARVRGCRDDSLK